MTISTVVLLMVVRFPVNGWTLRSVAYSLQDGCLASICTSYNEDSELDIWELTGDLSAFSRGDGVFVSHPGRGWVSSNFQNDRRLLVPLVYAFVWLYQVCS